MWYLSKHIPGQRYGLSGHVLHVYVGRTRLSLLLHTTQSRCVTVLCSRCSRLLRRSGSCVSGRARFRGRPGRGRAGADYIYLEARESTSVRR